MFLPAADRMSPEERRAGAALAAIFALRMLGLFLILPVFSIFARDLPGGDNLALVGFALGAYGLTQACFQIPYGIASDLFGRKRVIVIGLLVFALGSFVAAWAPDMSWVIVGRVLQGAGAISAAVTALAADLTREQHRTKVMAMIGSSIGLVFALSLVGAPVLYGLIGMGGLFVMTGVLALAAIVLLLKAVPPAPPPQGHGKLPLRRVIRDPDLMRLNLGIFLLHMMQMAMFVVLPHALVEHGNLQAADHWMVYLPAVLASFAVMVPAIIAAERRDRMRPVFRAAVALLAVVQCGLLLAGESLWTLGLWLLLFFVAFNILEASLPSLVSRTAPPAAKGAALGVYNTTQALGLFIGGAAGGYIAQHFGDNAVFAACAGLAILWSGVAATMNFPARRTTPGATQTAQETSDMASVNKAIIVGNLGKDPEVRYTASGEAMCNITVATSESWKDKATGEKKELTEWHRISFFGKLAEIAGQYLKKGSQVYVEGSIRTRKWTDKEGQERYTTEIRADEMKMLGSRQGMGAPASSGGGYDEPTDFAPAPAKNKPKPSFDDLGDDIPF